MQIRKYVLLKLSGLLSVYALISLRQKETRIYNTETANYFFVAYLIQSVGVITPKKEMKCRFSYVI
jgi:hypothetical protein